MIIEDNANACELNSLYTDMISVAVAKNSELNAFVIFRPATRESRATINKRFRIVTNFLRNYKGLKSKAYIFAIGERVDSQSRTEFYLGNRLFFVALAKRGKVPCMDCCGFDFNKGVF